MTVLVAARPAHPEEIPSAARKRVTKARSLGWEIYRCTYARGLWQGKEIESIALGFRKGRERVIITYEGAKYRTSWHLDDVDKRLTWVPSSRDIDSILKGASS